MLCQSILTLRVRPLQLSFGTVRRLAPDASSVDKRSVALMTAHLPQCLLPLSILFSIRDADDMVWRT